MNRAPERDAADAPRQPCERRGSIRQLKATKAKSGREKTAAGANLAVPGAELSEADSHLAALVPGERLSSSGQAAVRALRVSRISRRRSTSSGGWVGAGAASTLLSLLNCLTMRKMMKARMTKLMAMVTKLP